MILLGRPVGKISVLRAWVGFMGLLGLVAGLHSFTNQRMQFLRTHVYDLQPSEGELIKPSIRFTLKTPFSLSAVTELASRIFGSWALLAAMVRLSFAAYPHNQR